MLSIQYSSLLNTLKRNCFDDKQRVYCTNSRGTKARSWSCHSGLGCSGLVLIIRISSRSHHRRMPLNFLCPFVQRLYFIPGQTNPVHIFPDTDCHVPTLPPFRPYWTVYNSVFMEFQNKTLHFLTT